jgi:putative acetyltransferase
MKFELVEAYGHLSDVSALFQEYAASLSIDLNYQNFPEELSGLPGKYAKPDGRLYLAYVDGVPAGCIAMRRLDVERAEMKRLYVRPGFRGLKLGRMLAERVILDAANIGCRSLVLDTLSTMDRAQALYGQLGFVETAPYYNSPVAGTTYLCLSLTGQAQ